MKKHLFLVFIIIGFCQIYAQETPVYKSITPGYFIGISPFALIDIFDGPSIRLDAEVPVFSSIGIGLEGGFYPGTSLTYKEKSKGYLLKPVVKYYFMANPTKLRYIGLEYMHKEQTYNLRDSLDLNGPHYEKKYHLGRVTNSISLKYGVIEKLSNTFLFEWYLGLGIRYLSSVSSLTKAEQDAVLTGLDETTNVDHGDSMVKGLARESGKLIYPNFIVGLKIIYKIK